MPINLYLKEVKKRFGAGISTEHSYRSDLQVLLNTLVKGIIVTNEPKRQKCGAPDYIIQKKEVPIGYIEAKDIGIDLNKTEKSDQMKRYLGSLDNLILTDYLEFRFYKYGNKITEVKIASIENGKLNIHSENFSSFETHIKDFCGFKGQTIKSAEKLAKMMAQKARMMEEVLYNAVKDDEDEDNTLKDQLKAFRQILIHDLEEKTFSDIYAQTIAYGLFAARLHDETLDDFTRQEARELIPKSNPFLRNLFDYISGAQLDDRVIWIVNDLCEIFRATDLQSILSDFGKSTGQNDPFLHFYETFLAEYDAKLRKSRGVYYTPEPVVNFIVRAVDDILINEFNLPRGLADTSKVTIKKKMDGVADKKGKDVFEDIEVHKIQILDPATGTGTFLAETVKQIYSKFKGQEGLWSAYVEKDLIPRVNGFELLMASYTMCHLKIEMLLKETGYTPKDENKQPRLKVYLTNSLEEAHPETGTLFASWLSKESSEANYVKRDTPVMCIIGNPPYSKHSSNKGDWINEKMNSYKEEPTGGKLQERNSKWLNDDYVKFIRYGQHLIEKNSEGILAFINPHSFLTNPTFRGMRWSLVNFFDDIYTIDLHGNSNIQEKCPDGSPDQNVFDIKQGVSINFFIKKKIPKKTKLANIHHLDVFGDRELKYDWLLKTKFDTIKFEPVNLTSPFYFFSSIVPDDRSSYDDGFSLDDLFIETSTGYYTSCDEFVLDTDKNILQKRIKENLDKSLKYDEKKIKTTTYRPFDNRFIYYEPNILTRSRDKFVKRIIGNENIILISGKSSRSESVSHFFISRLFSELKCGEYTKGSYMFPLYLYETSPTLNGETKTINFNMDIIKSFEEILNVSFQSDEFTAESVIDYIYAFLYSNKYRNSFKELLKVDFPKIPFPDDLDFFKTIVKLGSELRSIHLIESEIFNTNSTTYPIPGNNIVEIYDYQENKVFINKKQYFGNISKSAWEFYIGGYQPAQKWLKDRKSQELSADDIIHYQKIITALVETEKLMNKIDDIVQL